ncbi:MAG: phasin family protein [Limnohabitans sp.]|jgi:phasin family protein
MMNTADLQATQKASVGQWFELADTALDETAKWMDMNLQVCRESIEDMARSCAGACEVRDLGSALQWQASALKPLAERSAEYGARLAGLASGSGLDAGRLVEAQWERLGPQLQAWMGGTTPALNGGSGDAMAYLRHAMQAFDSVWGGLRQNLLQAQQMGRAPAASPVPRGRAPRKQ